MSLDDDLAAWAATVRLADGDAAAIFDRIVASAVRPAVSADAGPAGLARTPRLKPSWWTGYNAGFAKRMVASTAPARLAA